MSEWPVILRAVELFTWSAFVLLCVAASLFAAFIWAGLIVTILRWWP